MHTLIKFKECKINGKIGIYEQKDRLTFSSLVFQINNGLKKRYSKHEIWNGVIKSIEPDLSLRALRTNLEGKDNLNLKTLKKILTSHFTKPNATSLFAELSNIKQLPCKSAQKFVVSLVSFRQKILFITKKENCGHNEVILQDCFLHAILFGLRNNNIKNELCPLLKNSILSDEDILENLMLAMSNEQEHFQNFNRKPVDKNSVEPCDAIPSAAPPRL